MSGLIKQHVVDVHFELFEVCLSAGPRGRILPLWSVLAVLAGGLLHCETTVLPGLSGRISVLPFLEEKKAGLQTSQCLCWSRRGPSRHSCCFSPLTQHKCNESFSRAFAGKIIIKKNMKFYFLHHFFPYFFALPQTV